MTGPQLVRDLMTVGVPTCAAATSLRDVARLLLDQDLEAVVVLDHEGHAAGIVSQYELTRAFAREDWRNLVAEQVMRENVPQIPPEIPLTAAVQIMQDQGVRVFFLMHHSDGIQYPAAMITYRHVLRLLAATDQEELKDLGIHARREAPLDTFFKRRDAARQRATRPPEE
jgi:CBS domain-containing protein